MKQMLAEGLLTGLRWVIVIKKSNLKMEGTEVLTCRQLHIYNGRRKHIFNIGGGGGWPGKAINKHLMIS